MPIAPGTWGSLAGLALGVAAAPAAGPLAWFLLAVAFWVCADACGRAERRMGRHDPPAVVLDETWGMAAVLLTAPEAAGSAGRLALAFLLFRGFDVAKPPPLRALARLPGGWGIMADDLGAAAYAVLCLHFLGY